MGHYTFAFVKMFRLVPSQSLVERSYERNHGLTPPLPIPSAVAQRSLQRVGKGPTLDCLVQDGLVASHAISGMLLTPGVP